MKRKLTQDEKAQIIHLHQQGLSGPEIADQMHIDDARQVVGVIRAAVNFKKVPSMTPPPRLPGVPITLLPPSGPPELPPEAPVFQQLEPAIQMSGAQPQAAPPASRPVHVPPAQAQPHPEFRALPPAAHAAPPVQVDGFGGNAWAPVTGFAGGFSYQTPSQKYMIYRLEPNDGLLGEHVDPFDEKTVGTTYGSGLYRVLRFTPGIPQPRQVEFRISQEYGPPRFKNQASAAAPQRPGYGRFSGGRPWLRSQEPREEEPLNEPGYDRPRSPYDWARHTSPPSNDATATAIKALGDANMAALAQAEQARKQGPDSFVTKFFGEQQDLWQRQIEQQRQQDDQRRRDEEEKWERRQKADEMEHRRRQEDEERRHLREIEKIRAETESRAKASEAERKMLMDLEASKLKVIEESNKLRQEALKEELLRSRQEQKEDRERQEKLEKERADRLEKQLTQMQESTSTELEETRSRLEAQAQKDREGLDREYKLREKAQEKEHELNSKILDVKQTALEAQGTNEIFQVVNNVINKFSSGLKEVVDLKKIEATANMAPEAQAAAVVHGMGEKKAEVQTESTSADTPAAAAQPAPSNGKTGNGQAADATTPPKEPPMEEMVAAMVEQPFFQSVIKEWARQIQYKQNATAFVNMYMQWMNDPVDHEARKATSMFANFISSRPWADLYAIIKPKLKADVIPIFDTKEADDYYETFRALVVEQITDFWESYAQEREAKKAARRAAAKPAEEPALK